MVGLQPAARRRRRPRPCRRSWPPWHLPIRRWWERGWRESCRRGRCRRGCRWRVSLASFACGLTAHRGRVARLHQAWQADPCRPHCRARVLQGHARMQQHLRRRSHGHKRPGPASAFASGAAACVRQAPHLGPQDQAAALLQRGEHRVPPRHAADAGRGVEQRNVWVCRREALQALQEACGARAGGRVCDTTARHETGCVAPACCCAGWLSRPLASVNLSPGSSGSLWRIASASAHVAGSAGSSERTRAPPRSRAASKSGDCTRACLCGISRTPTTAAPSITCGYLAGWLELIRL